MRPLSTRLPTVEWTARAEATLKAREDRYLSPTFFHMRDGVVMRIEGAALTNAPALVSTHGCPRSARWPLQVTTCECGSLGSSGRVTPEPAWHCGYCSLVTGGACPAPWGRIGAAVRGFSRTIPPPFSDHVHAVAA